MNHFGFKKISTYSLCHISNLLVFRSKYCMLYYKQAEQFRDGEGSDRRLLRGQGLNFVLQKEVLVL